MSLNVTTIRPEAWPDISAGFQDLSFEQTLSYSRAAADRIGAEVRCLLVRDASMSTQAAGIARIKRVPGLGRGIAWMPSGPLLRFKGADADPTPVLEALRQSLCNDSGHVLRIRHSPTAFLDADVAASSAFRAGFAETIRGKSYRTIILDLSLSEEALRARLEGKWRADLRIAERQGLQVDAGNGPDLQSRFLALFDRTMELKGFRPGIPPEFHFALDFVDYDLDILIAVHEGVDVAGVVAGAAGLTSVYLFGALNQAGRPLRAGYLLTWEALRRARKAGLRWYDLGGIGDENADVARFKTRMKGRETRAPVFEARPPGVVPRLILTAESTRTILLGSRGRRS